MTVPVSHVILRKTAVASDPKLSVQPKEKNNGRKVLVNTLYEKKEDPISSPEWDHNSASGLCPVLVTGQGGVEVASFTHDAGQDRHKHLIGTEIYTVLEGEMAITIDDGQPICLEAGDEIIVLPGTVHEVVSDERQFLTRVHSINCYGTQDKYVEAGGWYQALTLKNQQP